MKKITLLLLLITFTTYSQDFNGEYKSYETSYRSNIDSTQNFVEKTEFKIFISINENEGYIICQDPRIPNKLLEYRIASKVNKIQENYFYKNCINEHLKNNSTSDIVFYFDKEDNLNVMISNEKHSQVFKDLIKQD